MVELGTTDIKNDHISDLVNWHAKIDQVEHLFSGISKFSDFPFQVSVVSTLPLIFAYLS